MLLQNQKKNLDFSFRHGVSTDEGSPRPAPRAFKTNEMPLFKGIARELKPSSYKIHSTKKVDLLDSPCKLGEPLNQNAKLGWRHRSKLE